MLNHCFIKEKKGYLRFLSSLGSFVSSGFSHANSLLVTKEDGVFPFFMGTFSSLLLWGLLLLSFGFLGHYSSLKLQLLRFLYLNFWQVYALSICVF